MAVTLSSVPDNSPEDNKKKYQAGRAAIGRLARPARRAICAAQVLVLLSDVLAVAPYVALVSLGDLLLDAYNANTSVDGVRAKQVLMLLVVAYCLRIALYSAALLVTHFADLKLRSTVRKALVDRISLAPLAWFSESSSGAVRKAIQDDTTTVHTVIAHGPVEKLNAVTMTAALLIYVFLLNWRLGLLSMATLPLYFITNYFSLRTMSEKTAEMDTKLASVSSTMADFVSGITVIKAFGQVGKAHKNYEDATREFSRFYKAWCMPLVTISCIGAAWISIPVLLLVNLGGGALLIQAGAATLPQVLATTLVSLAVPTAINTVIEIEWSYQLAGSAAVRLCDLLDTPTMPRAASPKLPQGNRIDIEKVSYSYGHSGAADQVCALSDVSLVLNPGTVTALVGPSGSGKSTLGSLVARFADPDRGSIRIGGVDLREMEDEALYKQVSFVLQDAQLLGISVKDNIALGRPDSDLEQIRRAARVAQVDEEIMALPHGYDTVLGSETRLSGGQEQRIAIARAILKDAPVLVLDEATALTDPESEADIQRALSALVADKTVLVIAHRTASIRGASQIAVLDRARIVACGTHDELVDEPHYHALLAQSGDLAGAGEPINV